MSGGLQVHNVSLIEGRLAVTIADQPGRHLCLELQPSDHPALEDAYERFCEAIVAATSVVMLDLLEVAGVQATMPDVPTVVVPCRICGDDTYVAAFTEAQRGAVLTEARCRAHTT